MINLMSTLKGSALEGFFPEGWDMDRIDWCCGLDEKQLLTPESFWNDKFIPEPCNGLEEFNPKMGHEIAFQIKKARDEGVKLAMILPIGPMGCINGRCTS